MLIENYLPDNQFSEQDSITVNAARHEAYSQMLNADLSKSSLIKFLFRLRGMPKNLSALSDITKLGFVKLDEAPDDEIVFGMITSSPVFNNCISISSADEFVKAKGGIIKAVINFKVTEGKDSLTILSTETRIWCGSNKLKYKFVLYWIFVKPFSKLVRKLILRQMVKQLG